MRLVFRDKTGSTLAVCDDFREKELPVVVKFENGGKPTEVEFSDDKRTARFPIRFTTDWLACAAENELLLGGPEEVEPGGSITLYNVTFRFNEE